MNRIFCLGVAGKSETNAGLTSLSRSSGFLYPSSPLQERWSECGGCELQRLLDCPVAIGFFKPFPTPSRSLCFRSQCCGRGVGGLGVAIAGKNVGTSDADGLVPALR